MRYNSLALSQLTWSVEEYKEYQKHHTLLSSDKIRKRKDSSFPFMHPNGKCKTSPIFQRIQWIVLSISLLPLRLFFLLLSFLLSFPIWILVSYCCHRKKRKMFQIYCRIVLFIIGVYNIKIKGHLDMHINLRICNATSLLDHFILGACTCDTLEGNSTWWIFLIPIFGNILSRLCTRILYMENNLKCKTSRIVFPEGTTSNGKQVISFDTRWFTTGENIQPLIVQYSYDQAFVPTYESLLPIVFLWRLLTTVSTPVCVTFLPTVRPSTFESRHPTAWSQRLRMQMARALHVPPVAACFADKIQYQARLGQQQAARTWYNQLGPDVFAAPNVILQENENHPIILPDLCYCCCHETVNGCTNLHKHSLDIFLPAHENVKIQKTEKLPPLVVWVHGGGWQRGDRRAWHYFLSSQDVNLFVYILQKYVFRCYSNVGISLATLQYPVIVPSYRLSTLQYPYRALEILTSSIASFCMLYPLIVLLWHMILLHRTVNLYCVCLGMLGLVGWRSVATERKFHTTSIFSRTLPWKILGTASIVFWYYSTRRLELCFVALFCTLIGTLVHALGQDPVVMHPKHVDDIAVAIQWTLQHADTFRFDPSRIVLCGHSAGAHLAALLALDPTILAKVDISVSSIIAVVGISGVYDLQRIQLQHIPNQLYIVPVFQSLHESSPITHVHLQSPPFLLLHAANDATLLQEDAQAFQKALEFTGMSSVNLITLPGYDHLSIITTIQALIPSSGTTSSNHPVLHHIQTLLHQHAV